MNKKIIRQIFSLAAVIIILLPSVSFAGALNQSVRTNQDNQLSGLIDTNGSYNRETKIGDVIGVIIQAFIGLLGIIFIVLIIYAGFNWMTAGGDEAKVTKAKETLERALIGLVIVLAAYAITFFVFNSLNTLNGPGGGGTSP